MCKATYKIKHLFRTHSFRGRIHDNRDEEHGSRQTGRALDLSVYILIHKHKAERDNWEWCEFLNDTPLLSRPCLLILHRQFHQLGTKHLNVLAYGAIVIQANTEIACPGLIHARQVPYC